MSTTTNLSTLKINYLTQAQYETALANDQINEDELYFTPDSTTVVSHTHGNITNDGALQTTDVTIANGDKMIVTDSSDSNKIARTSLSFGTSTTQYLANNGTWQNLPQGTAYSAGTGLSLSETTFNHSNSVTVQTTQAVYPIKIDAQGHISEYGSAITIPTKTSDLTNDSNFITGYTETDPVYSVSPAAGITSTDITNWNNKVSDDHKWGGVALGDSGANLAKDQYVPEVTTVGNTSGTAYWLKATVTPTAYCIAKYDSSNSIPYLNSSTPTAGDSSTKVATTAFVQGELPTKVSDLTNDAGYTTNTGTVTGVKVNGTTKSPSSGIVDIGTLATTDTNTTYSLSNALSSHKFTSTLTAGGSGSGTSTATMELVAGTGISLTDDTTNKKITIASSVTNTDEKVKLTSNTGSTAVNIVLGPTSITSGTAYNCLYNTNLKYTPSTGNLQTTQLNGVTVGSTPKFTDTVTTVTSSGSGNVVTGMSASNGAITYTKGTISTGATCTVSATAPSSPQTGDMWFILS